MNKILKWVLMLAFIFLGMAALGYTGYRVYNYLIEDATRKITKGVKKGIGQAFNPFIWPGKIVGGGK